MRERIQAFMVGRNGNDQFNIFLLIVGVVLLLISSIVGGTVGKVFSALMLADIVYMWFRMMSRQVYKRQEENGKYMRIAYQVSGKLKLIKERWVQRKDYKFFTCSECHTTLRVPRGKGKVNIVCRKCGKSFIGKT